MRQIFLAWRLGAWLLALGLALSGAANARDPVQVRLIGINDLHGNLEGTNLVLFLADPGAPPGAPDMRVQVGGADALAGLVQKLRAGAPQSFMLAGGEHIGTAPLGSTVFNHACTTQALKHS